MAEKLTNEQLAIHYVSLNDTRKRYVEMGLFNDKLEFTYADKIYRVGPFRLGLPEIAKDTNGNDVTKGGIALKYIDIINDYDLMVLINKTIYEYLKNFILYSEENRLVEYE